MDQFEQTMSANAALEAGDVSEHGSDITEASH